MIGELVAISVVFFGTIKSGDADCGEPYEGNIAPWVVRIVDHGGDGDCYGVAITDGVHNDQSHYILTLMSCLEGDEASGEYVYSLADQNGRQKRVVMSNGDFVPVGGAKMAVVPLKTPLKVQPACWHSTGDLAIPTNGKTATVSSREQPINGPAGSIPSGPGTTHFTLHVTHDIPRGAPYYAMHDGRFYVWGVHDPDLGRAGFRNILPFWGGIQTAIQECAKAKSGGGFCRGCC